MSDNQEPDDFGFSYDEDDEVARDRSIDRTQSEALGDSISLERTDDGFDLDDDADDDGPEPGDYDRDEIDAEGEEYDAVQREMHGGYDEDRSYE